MIRWPVTMAPDRPGMLAWTRRASRYRSNSEKVGSWADAYGATVTDTMTAKSAILIERTMRGAGNPGRDHNIQSRLRCRVPTFCVTFSATHVMGNSVQRLVRQVLRTSDVTGMRTCGEDLFRPAILAIILIAATVSVSAEGVRIVPLVRDDSVLVSFELTDGYTPAV